MMIKQMKLKSTRPYEVYPVADVLRWVVINKSSGHIVATFIHHTMASRFVEKINSKMIPPYADEYEVRELYEEKNEQTTNN